MCHMTDTNDKVAAYRDWILSQDLDDVTIEEGANGGLVLKGEGVDGWVNFYDLDDQTVVELRLEKKSDGSSLFFLHFELEDPERARKLFLEMTSVLDTTLHQEPRHVLLSCTCGMTTTFFANKLNELATEFDLGYDFCAKPVEEAMEDGTSFEAVLLAPQVGHRLKEVREALPGVTVLELPASVYGAYDANGALRLLMEALQTKRIVAKGDLRFARDFDRTKSILSLSYVERYDEPTISYVVLVEGEERLRGTLVRSWFDMETAFNDLIVTLRLNGYPIESFDAVGIAIPGVVHHGKVDVWHESGPVTMDVASRLSDRLGVPVFIDNSATAAAAGCYVSQADWDDLVFHAQPIGNLVCEEGYVLNGKTRNGRKGFGGTMRYLVGKFALSMSLDEAAWRYDGMCELTACHLGSVICTVAPQAIFVWCDLLPDMDELREELAKFVPEEAIPELIPVADYDGLTLMGELSLCLQRLVES